jgi:hypothetical protein
MKTPAHWHFQTHHIGDHSKHKGNNGKRDDHTTLHATLGKPVNAKSLVRICWCEQVDQESTNRDARNVFAIRMMSN